MGLGLPAPEFWTITLCEVDVIMRAAADRAMRQKRLDDGRTYTLAQLVVYAVNDPKRMPKFEKVFPTGKERRMSPEESLAAMRAWVDAAQAAMEGKRG